MVRADNGVIMSAEQAGLLVRKQRAIWSPARDEFYAHYLACPACRPTGYCQVGSDLQRVYNIKVSASSILFTRGRDARRTALSSVSADLRLDVQKEVERLFDARSQE